MKNLEFIVGLPETRIPTPALVVDVEIMERNITTMMDYLSKTKARLRPHTKTHKTPMIGHLLAHAGAIGHCCATVGEAEAMVYSGLHHIFIASEVVSEDKILRLAALAGYTDVMVAFDNLENLRALSDAAAGRGATIGVLVDVDVGMGRCGVRSVEDALPLAQAAQSAKGIAFRGVFGYEGHAVMIHNRQERTEVCRAANARLVQAADGIKALGIPVEIVTAAGTGTYDIAAESPGITEIEAGSFIFMDSTYSQIDIPFQQSLTVVSTIISRPDEKTAILDVGMKGISVERAAPSVKDYPGIEIEKLSEAHAKAIVSEAGSKSKPGDRLHLIPSHCCTTVNLYDQMFVLRGGIVEAVWPITARGPY